MKTAAAFLLAAFLTACGADPGPLVFDTGQDAPDAAQVDAQSTNDAGTADDAAIPDGALDACQCPTLALEVLRCPSPDGSLDGGEWYASAECLEDAAACWSECAPGSEEDVLFSCEIVRRYDRAFGAPERPACL